MLLDFTVVLYIQENVGWRWGFGIPAICMLISIVLFLVGYPIYMLHKLARSCGSRRSSLPRSGSYQKRRDESRGESDRSDRGCAYLRTNETNLPIVSRWEIRMGNYWRVFFFFFPKK